MNAKKLLPYAVGVGYPVAALVFGKEMADGYLHLTGEGSLSWDMMYDMIGNLPLYAKISGGAFLGGSGIAMGYITNKIQESRNSSRKI